MSAPFWNIVELVEWGLYRRAEAERLEFDWITASEIYWGASRISNSVEQFDAIIEWWIKQKRAQSAAFVVLKRVHGGPSGGAWIVYDYGNVIGDRRDVNAWMQRMQREGIAV